MLASDHLPFVPSMQAQILLAQNKESIRVLVVWEGERVVIPKWKEDKELRYWPEAKDAAKQSCPWPALGSFCPPHCIPLLRASDTSHRNSETPTNHSWFHFWRNNIQGPLKTFTILSLAIMESEAFPQIAILCLNCLCLFYSLDLSTPRQVFLLLYLNLPGSLKLEFNNYLLHRIVFCTVFFIHLFYKCHGVSTLRRHHIGTFPSYISFPFNNSAYPPLPWSLPRSIPSGPGNSVLLFCHFSQFPKHLAPLWHSCTAWGQKVFLPSLHSYKCLLITAA